MRKSESSFPSSDGLNTVAYSLWMPDGNPRGVVQIVHGMVEYIDRYDEFARYLADHGLVVCGHDHIGHGRSAGSPDDYGYFGKKDGDTFLVKDVELLRQIIRKKYPSLPYILMGHSMGSFVTRAYVSSYPEAVDAVILSGTAGGGKPFGLAKFLCNTVALFRGGRHRSNFIKNLAFGGYNKRFEGNTGSEWVTSDPERLEAYVSDPRSSFTFTVQGYHDLFTLLAYVNSDKWYNSMPKHLPILFIAGSEDPVGNYTQGVYEVADKLDDREVSDITVKIYEGERHEVHNGLRRAECFSDVQGWIDGVISGIHAAKIVGYYGGNGSDEQ